MPPICIIRITMPSTWAGFPIRYARVACHNLLTGQYSAGTVATCEQATMFPVEQNQYKSWTDEDKLAKKVCKKIREVNPDADIDLIFLAQNGSSKTLTPGSITTVQIGLPLIPKLDYVYHVKEVYRAISRFDRNKGYVAPLINVPTVVIKPSELLFLDVEE